MNGNDINELDQMAKMATMPIYGKNLKNLLQNQWLWNLVCSIGYQSSTKECSNDDFGLTMIFFTARLNVGKF